MGTGKTAGKWAAAAAIVLAVLGGIAFLLCRGLALEKEAQAAWAQAYMAAVANYGADYDKLPPDMEAYQDWLGQGPYLPSMKGGTLPGDALSQITGLAEAYRTLCAIRLKDPENEACRALFEELAPYFKNAFTWAPGTNAPQCLSRLAEFSQPEVQEEIGRLREEVGKLYVSTEAETIWHPIWFGTVASGGDLQTQPREYVSTSGDLVAAPRVTVSSDSDLKPN